jgi:hypothetical protein
MSFAFKRFNFFSRRDIPGHALPPSAAAVVTGGGRVFAAADGALHVLDETFSAVAVVPAFGHKLLLLAWAEVRGAAPRRRGRAGGVGLLGGPNRRGTGTACGAAAWVPRQRSRHGRKPVRSSGACADRRPALTPPF